MDRLFALYASRVCGWPTARAAVSGDGPSALTTRLAEHRSTTGGAQGRGIDVHDGLTSARCESMTFSQREKAPMQHPRSARALHRGVRGETAEGLRSFSRRL